VWRRRAAWLAAAAAAGAACVPLFGRLAVGESPGRASLAYLVPGVIAFVAGMITIYPVAAAARREEAGPRGFPLAGLCLVCFALPLLAAYFIAGTR
jgi:hypothetical protein